MAGHEMTPQEMAALELYHQLVNLTPDDGNRDLMVTLRLPSGRYVGDVWLSLTDVEATADKLIQLNIQRADQDDPPAAPLPADQLPEVDPAMVAAGIAALQELADDAADGGQA